MTDAARGADKVGVEGELLDMEYKSNQRLLTRAISLGWVTPEECIKYKLALNHAMNIAIRKGDVRGIRSCVETFAGIVRIQQDAEQFERKLDAVNGQAGGASDDDLTDEERTRISKRIENRYKDKSA